MEKLPKLRPVKINGKTMIQIDFNTMINKEEAKEDEKQLRLLHND